MFTASTATVLGHSHSHPPQIEGANFLNLLIVDDDRTIREACREVAQSLGFNTQVAESAEQAYRLLDSSSTDAVLLDLRLPRGCRGLRLRRGRCRPALRRLGRRIVFLCLRHQGGETGRQSQGPGENHSFHSKNSFVKLLLS